MLVRTGSWGGWVAMQQEETRGSQGLCIQWRCSGGCGKAGVLLSWRTFSLSASVFDPDGTVFSSHTCEIRETIVPFYSFWCTGTGKMWTSSSVITEHWQSSTRQGQHWQMVRQGWYWLCLQYCLLQPGVWERVFRWNATVQMKVFDHSPIWLIIYMT